MDDLRNVQDLTSTELYQDWIRSTEMPPSPAQFDKEMLEERKIIEEDDEMDESYKELLLCLCSAPEKNMDKGKTVAPTPPCRRGSLQKEAVSRAAGKVAVESEDHVTISYMSENPRIFGNLQSEEKEYFSGSIVESNSYGECFEISCMSENPSIFGNLQSEEKEYYSGSIVESNSSHNQEGIMKAGLGEAAAEEVKKDKGMKGKRIRRKKSSSSKKPKK